MDKDLSPITDEEIDELRLKSRKEKENKSSKQGTNDPQIMLPEAAIEPQSEKIRFVRQSLPPTQCETIRIFRSHLARELSKKKFVVPDYLRTSSDDICIKMIGQCCKLFSTSELRQWLNEQIERIDYESLTLTTYFTLLKDLYHDFPELQGKGNERETILDRVMLLFFFCSDIIIKIHEEVPGHRINDMANRYYDWSCQFMSRELAPIIDREGGWRSVLSKEGIVPKEHPVISTRGLAVTVFCIAAIAVFIYCRYKRSH